MGQKIDQDLQRFRKLVRGKVKSNLSKYISRGEMIGKKGNDSCRSRCRRSTCRSSATARRTPAASASGPASRASRSRSRRTATATRRPATQPGGHILEVDLTMEELAEILGEELALPRIEPRGQKNIVTEKDKYTTIRSVGPESLRHFKRTYKRALKRQIAAGTYDPSNPMVIPVREDKQYRSWKEVPKPDAVAVRHLHDGRVRQHDRRAEGDRPHRVVLDRHLDQAALQGRRDGLHHPRRDRAGGGRAPLLPHPRERRDEDQFRLRAVQQDHRLPLPAERSGTSTPSTSPTATTGATTCPSASSC